MFFNDRDMLVRQEQNRDLLREAERERLIQSARIRQGRSQGGPHRESSERHWAGIGWAVEAILRSL